MRGALMEAEIAAQPALLRGRLPEFVAAAAKIAARVGQRGTPAMVVLAARGSSDNAALYARYLFEIALGVPVVLAAPSLLTRYGAATRYPRALAIGISQSGAAPDVSEVIERMRSDGHDTVALTNTPGSRLAQAAESTILLGVGKEESVAATKTFTATLLALHALARAFDPTLPAPEPFDDAWVEIQRAAAEEASGLFVRSAPTFSLARGYAFSAAHETALKMMECALVPTKAYSLADFQHGPKALAGIGSAAVAFGGGAQAIAEQGCEVVVPPDPPVAEAVAPLWHIVFGQSLALAAARARGLDPDSPPHLSKVTRTR